ncbi:hypothetical protein D0Y65_025296 [Glycine soja]|uniref:Uncharacterized protein n=1 Tax=Glycine soja TaxID=3848 RepID=A0A445J695_GLYSO|nr:hypothetical protein D0Y65_025296 [Glycine soja]
MVIWSTCIIDVIVLVLVVSRDMFLKVDLEFLSSLPEPKQLSHVVSSIPLSFVHPPIVLCTVFNLPPWHKELGMSVMETPKKTGAPQIVKLDKALKLAELWVNNMSKDADDDRTNADVEDRPSGLGLGAKVSRQSKFVASGDPVERKLYAKLNAEKRKAANIAKSLLPHLQEML